MFTPKKGKGNLSRPSALYNKGGIRDNQRPISSSMVDLSKIPSADQSLNDSKKTEEELGARRKWLLITFIIIGICATIVSIGVVCGILLRTGKNDSVLPSNPTTTTTSTTTTTTTVTTLICVPACINGGNCTANNTCTCDTNMWTGPYCETAVRIFWSFDNNLRDMFSNFHGVTNYSQSYLVPGYNGAGGCLWLNQSLRQSVAIPSPYLNLTYTSFSLETWIYANTLYNSSPYIDNGIFGQCESLTLDRCLHTAIRNQRIYLGFVHDDLSGNQIIKSNEWYHLAYVYDYSVSRQYVYVNGYLDGSRNGAGPYLGRSGILTIGTNGISAPNNYFDGCIDSLSYFARARNATEILNAATAVAFLSFDGYRLVDSGPLLINGTGSNYSFISLGRVNQALLLNSNSSYIQITGLRRIGTNGWPYSVAIWINPTSLSGGTIIHLSSRTNGGQLNSSCLPIMGLSSSGQVAINSWNGSTVSITGPIVPVNTWTHVVATYSSINGQRLYVNGSQYGAVSAAFTFSTAGVPQTITLGNSLAGTGVCNSSTIQMGQFRGSLDEFRVYARELTASEVVNLANP